MTWNFNYPPHCRSGNNQSVRSSVPVVGRWLWPGNRTYLEVTSVVVTSWIVACLRSVNTWTIDWPKFLMKRMTCIDIHYNLYSMRNYSICVYMFEIDDFLPCYLYCINYIEYSTVGQIIKDIKGSSHAVYWLWSNHFVHEHKMCLYTYTTQLSDGFFSAFHIQGLGYFFTQQNMMLFIVCVNIRCIEARDIKTNKEQKKGELKPQNHGSKSPQSSSPVPMDFRDHNFKSFILLIYGT